MFCTNCGKQVADEAKFCPNCGNPIVANQGASVSAASEAPATSKKAPTGSKKRVPLLIGVVAIVVVLAIAAASQLGNDDADKAIQTVKKGYLGTFTDITVEEIINYTFLGDENRQGVVWDGGTTDDGIMIVEARYTDQDGQEIKLQFRMIDEETFRYGGMTGISDLSEAVKYLNMMYFNYYCGSEETGDPSAAEAIIDRLNQVSCGAVLCGASVAYEGDRENLYQSAFDMEALPATAANYLGLLQTMQPETPAYDSSAYSSILGGYYIALSDGYSASMLEEYGLNPLCAYYDYSQVGYAIKDVDGNGIPELLIGEIGEWGGGSGAFFDLYTLTDGQPVRVFASSERERYYLCQDGAIAAEGSSGADDSFNAYYAIDSVSGTPSIIEAVLYQGFFQDAGPWFYTACEPWEASIYDGSQIEISESEAVQIMESHPYEIIEFQAIPAM